MTKDMERVVEIIIKKIEELHFNNEHEEIIELINSIDNQEKNYELICLYARALNNTAKYQEAITELLSVENEGKQDYLWFFRLGYSYYYLGELDKAVASFTKSLELDTENSDETLLFLALCYHEQGEDEKYEQTIAKLKKVNYAIWDRFFNPIQYEEEDRCKVITYIEEQFGEIAYIIEGEDLALRVDVCVIEPQGNRDYLTLVTLGMGALSMNIGNENNHPRSELMMCLPKDWDMDCRRYVNRWPVNYLQSISHLPFEQDSCLGNGHLVISNGPLAANTQLNSFILLDAPLKNEEKCLLDNDEEIDFYLLFPLYPEESDYKETNGTDKLMELFEDVSYVVDLQRSNYAQGEEKYQEIGKQIERISKS